MRILPLFIALLACGADPLPDSEPAEPDPNAPRRYRVLRGDTLNTIASKRSCQPSDIVNWNGLGADPLLVPGQILLIYRENQKIALRPATPTGDDNEALPTRAPQPGDGDGVAIADIPDPEPRPDPGDGRPAVPPKRHPAPAPSAQPSQVVSNPRPERIAVNTGGKRLSRHGTEILSLLDEIGDSKLEHVASVKPSGKTPGEAGLDGRSLEGAGSADNDTVTIERPKTDPVAAAKLAGSGSVPKLAKAAPKKCLPVVLADLGDKGMATPDGLDRTAIKQGMAPIVRAVEGCLSSDTSGTWDMHIELTVGCDGLVYNTDVVMDGGLPRGITRCVAQVADQGSFAAAQGVTTFLFPIRFQK